MTGFVYGLWLFVDCNHGPVTLVAISNTPPPLQFNTRFEPLIIKGGLRWAGGTVTVATELVTAPAALRTTT